MNAAKLQTRGHPCRFTPRWAHPAQRQPCALWHKRRLASSCAASVAGAPPLKRARQAPGAPTNQRIAA